MCETLQRKVKKERDDSSVSLETDIGKWNEMEDTMNIAIDIDDTLTESFDYFLPYVAEYFGADKEELRKQNIKYAKEFGILTVTCQKSGRKMKLTFVRRTMTELFQIRLLTRFSMGGETITRVRTSHCDYHS